MGYHGDLSWGFHGDQTEFMPKIWPSMWGPPDISWFLKPIIVINVNPEI